MLRISVIIPVFNAEKYLDRCLKSVLASLGEIKGEILLINNNSTDNSPKIIDKYTKKYPKTIFSHNCTTPGAGAARNLGVAKARGEYIWFVDADDEVTRDAISKLLKAAQESAYEITAKTGVKSKKKANLVMLGMKKIYPNKKEVVFTAIDPEEPNFKSRFVRYGMGPVQFLILREWWNKHGLKFRETGMHEDVELMSSLILYTDNLASVNQPLYLYYQNPGSVLYREEWNESYFDIFKALENIYKRFKDKGAIETYHDELEWFFIWNLLIDSAEDFKRYPEGRDGFRRSRELLEKYFPKWRKNRFLKEKPIRLKVKVRLNYGK